MSVYEVDPLQDERWLALIERDSRASVFHHPAWLQALQRSYGYKPVVLTTSAPGDELTNGIAFCRVNSWLTGRRMVSLPFSDHCEPLTQPHELAVILEYVQSQMESSKQRYIELRPVSPVSMEVCESDKFALHAIDLRRGSDVIFKSLHKDSIRRKIQRAQREHLVYECGTSERLLKHFYRLYLMTRRRHGMPPSPFRWFLNIIECLGNRAQVRLVSKGEQPTAAIFTLKFAKTMVYKYGASDARLNNLGGTPFLFWNAIEEAKSEGLEKLDLGRSNPDNEGLMRFKEHLGGTRSPLTYWRLPMSLQPTYTRESLEVARRLLTHAPKVVQIGVGAVFSRHMG